jgi:hypothetical protein
MPATLTLVTGSTGQSGPITRGDFASEIWKVTGAGDGTATLSPFWLRQIACVLGPVTIVSGGIVNTTTTPSAALTFPTLASGSFFFIEVLGFWR